MKHPVIVRAPRFRSSDERPALCSPWTLFSASRSGVRRRWTGADFGVLLLAGALGTGCRDLERFDTGDTDAYCGPIIDSAFTRQGFAPGLGLRLTLDIDALDVAPGSIRTNDTESGLCSPEFDDAELRVTRQLLADPLSLLEFGSTRDYNFVAWVDSQCKGSALAVVSLMHTGDVEVRLLRRADPLDPGAPDDFGVFQLQRGDCNF